MSAYTDKIEKHVIHTELENVKNEISIISKTLTPPPAEADALARISMIITNFSIALNSCDKNLIAIAWLNDSNSNLVNIKSYLANYKSTKNAAYIVSNAVSQLDALLNTTVKLNCVKSKSSFRGLTDVINEYTNVLSANTKASNEKVVTLTADVDSLRKQIEANEQSTQKNLTELINTINAEKKRLDGFGNSYQTQMNNDQKEFASMLATLKESFATTQEERKKEFVSEIDNIQTKVDEINQNAIEQSNSIKQSNEQLIKDYETRFANYEDQVKNIVGIINTNVFSHKYKDVADDAHTRATIWHRITVGLMITTALFAFYALILTVNNTTNWIVLVAKIFTTTTLVTSAAYTARQASKQEKVERYARQIEMELVAIDPFIASLPEAQQAIIKEDLSKKLFGNTNVMEMNSKDEPYAAFDNLTVANDFIKSLSDFIGKIKK